MTDVVMSRPTTYSKWRRRIAGDGLLLSVKEAQDVAAAGRTGSAATAGVSLAWLQGFADALRASEGRDVGDLTTAAVVAKLVSVATTLRLASSGNGDPAQAPNGSANQGCSSSAQPPASPSTGSLGIGAGAGNSQAAAVAAAAALVCERREVHVRLFDLIPSRWTGKPHYYIIHAWQGSFLACLQAVISRLVAQNGGMATPSYLEDTYVWFDWVAHVQQAWQLLPGCSSPCVTYSTGNTPQYWGPPPGHVDVVATRDIQSRCTKGSLLVLDSDMAVLNRLWPLYEAWAATYFAPTGVGGMSSLLLVLTANMRSGSLLTLRSACEHLDLTRAECSRPEDRQRITGEVKASAGLKRMQQALGEALTTGIRSYLRWSGELEDLALFAILLLQSGDYAQLQHLLHSLPGLADDENTLNEIRAIFYMYDSDGTGELEEDEFAAVLALAGFGEEEAHRIFATVDVDGGGSVGLEEFETWWIESQRQQVRDMRPAVQLTLGGLMANLRALAAMLERRELESHAALVTQHADSLEAAGVGGCKSSETRLPYYAMHGDYLTVADQVVFKIMSGDLRSALRLVLDLLHLNSDALALDAPPDQVLPPASSIAIMPVPVQRSALAWAMALVAELLGRNPGRLREAEHFAREALDLASQGAPLDQLGAPMPSHKKKKPRKPARQDHKTRDAIVTSMVRLKYGKESLISHRLIAEASISLSTWMASSKATGTHKFLKDAKGANKKGGAATAAGDVNEFANSYLGNGQKPREGNQGATAKENRLPIPLPEIARVLYAQYQAAQDYFAKEAPEVVTVEVRPDAGPTDALDADDQFLLPILPTPSPHPDAAPPSPTLSSSNAAVQQQSGKPTPYGRAFSPGAGAVRARSPGVSAACMTEPDDAGIEHLTHFARACRSRNDQTPSPFEQLGSRLERVRTRQASVPRPSYTAPSSPILTRSMVAERLNLSEAKASANKDQSNRPDLISLCSMRRPSKPSRTDTYLHTPSRSRLSMARYDDELDGVTAACENTQQLELGYVVSGPRSAGALYCEGPPSPVPGIHMRPRSELRFARHTEDTRHAAQGHGAVHLTQQRSKALPAGLAGLNANADPRAARLAELSLPPIRSGSGAIKDLQEARFKSSLPTGPMST